MRGIGTDQILENIKIDEDEAYWDEFLGDYANKTRGEDRIFATSIRLNALIDVWTIKIANAKNGQK